MKIILDSSADLPSKRQKLDLNVRYTSVSRKKKRNICSSENEEAKVEILTSQNCSEKVSKKDENPKEQSNQNKDVEVDRNKEEQFEEDEDISEKQSSESESSGSNSDEHVNDDDGDEDDNLNDDGGDDNNDDYHDNYDDFGDEESGRSYWLIVEEEDWEREEDRD